MNRIEKMIAELCPNGVDWKSLKEISKFYNGLTGKIKSDFENGNVKYVTYKNIFSNMAVDFNKLEYVRVEDNEKQNSIQIGDVLVTTSSESKEESGMTSVVTRKVEENIYLNSFSFGIRFNDDIELSPEFTKHIFRDGRIRKQIVKTANGVTRFNISKEAFEKITIPIPPLEIQEEIVKILDKMTGYVTELQSELQMRTKQYEYYREDLLTFEDHKVEWKTLGELAEITTGSSNTNEGLEFGKYPFYVRSQEVRFKNEYEYDDISVITSGDGVGVGKIFHMTDGKYALHQRAYRICPREELLPKYLFYCMKTNFYNHISKSAVSSSVTSVRKPMLEKFYLPVPSLEIQEKIVYVLDNFDKVCNDLNIGLPKEIELRQKEYEYYREKLLTFDVKYSKPTLADTSRHENLLRLYQYVYGYVEVKIGEVLEKKSGTKITAKQMKELHKENAPVKIFAGGQTFASVNYEDIPRKDIHMESSIIVKSRGIVEFEYYENPFSHKSEFWSYHSENEDVNIKYVYYYLKLHEQYFRNIASKMQMPQIASGDTQNFKILLPSISKQNQIVEILDKFDELVNSTKTGLNKEIELRQKQYEYWREKLLTF